MIKATVLYATTTMLLVGCNSANTNSSIKTTDSSTRITTYNYPALQGTYRGDFDGSEISVVLRYISGKHAAGYNIHKGLRRNMSGPMQPAKNGFSFLLSEPGDNPYDGVFSLNLDTSTLQITGNWKPVNTAKLTEKQFVLKRDWTDTLEKSFDGHVYADSIGKFEFLKDGLCTYRYYPQGRGQLTEVKGNWTLHGNAFIIDWEPNTTFTNKRSTFNKRALEGTEGKEYYEVELVGEGRVLYLDEI